MNKAIYLFLLIIICLNPNQMAAQTIEFAKSYDESLQLYENGEFDEAQKILKRLIKKYPKEIDALMLLGDIEMKKENWQKAKDWYVDITKIKANHIDAFYKLGICDREDGIGRDIVTQLIMWKNSGKNFNTVILLDSTYKQVYYEYSLLKRYEKKYNEAIDLCHKQLKIDSNNRDAVLGLFYYYDLYITYAGENLISMFNDLDKAQIEWLKNRNEDIDIFFIGEKYRRLDKFNQADSIFKNLSRKHNPLLKIPLFLAQVRLFYQMDKPEIAEDLYNKALDAINSTIDIAFMFEDAKYILQDSDLIKPLGSLEAIQSFYRNIWNRKNPLNSLQSNYRLAEHYKRLVYCEKNYRYDGFRFPVNNPDRTNTLEFPNIFYNNKKFNHKGLVYIRYGPPDDKALKIDQGLPNNESWLYYENNQRPKYMFHFEVAEQAPANDWRLVPVPSNPLMLESRLGWDRQLDQYYMAKSPLDVNSVIGSITIESVKNVRRAMNSDQHTWDKKIESIPVYSSSAWFLDDEGKVICEIFLGCPAGEITTRIENDDEQIETGLALMDSNWNIIYKEIQNPEIETHIERGQFIDKYTISALPVKAYLNVHITDKDNEFMGGKQAVVNLKSPDTKELLISDLLMAYSVEPAVQTGLFSRHGLKIIPNPSKQAKKDSLVYFYYEIYNLKEIDGQSRYSIEQTVKSLTKTKNAFQKFIGMFGGDDDQSISISKEHQTQGSTAYEYTAFDFRSLSAGQVEIKIKIKDLNSGEVTEESMIFSLL